MHTLPYLKMTSHEISVNKSANQKTRIHENLNLPSQWVPELRQKIPGFMRSNKKFDDKKYEAMEYIV